MINLIEETIKEFFNDLKNETIKVDDDFDNEFGLQFELGIRLRNALTQKSFTEQGYKVYFEKNIKNICSKNKQEYNNDTVKKEIDLLIAKTSNEQLEELYAIELKFPRNGQYPEQMYSFVKDLKFIAQLKEGYSFEACWSVVLVDDVNFCKTTNRKTTNEIYTYFREDRIKGNNLKKIEVTIKKPTGKYEDEEQITESYERTVQWNQINRKELYYYIIKV